MTKLTQFFKEFFTDVIRRDSNTFHSNLSLGVVSVFDGATLDSTISNLMVTLFDLQDERAYLQDQNPLLFASEKPCNSLETIESSSLKLRNLRSKFFLNFFPKLL